MTLLPPNCQCQNCECRFDGRNVPETLRRYESIADRETCPHIRKTRPSFGDIEVYAVMDSPCHTIQPEKGSNCDKFEGTYMRIVAKKQITSKSAKPQAVTCTLRSLRTDLLTFPEGDVQGSESILDMKAKKRPIWVTPIYMKAGGVNWNLEPVRVDRFHQDELIRAPIQLDVLVWRESEFPEGRHNRQQISLSVAIPPNGQSHMRNALIDGETNMTGLEIVGAIATALKVVKDAPSAIKALKDLGVNIGLLEAGVEKDKPQVEIDESQPIGILAKGLIDDLNDLTREYNQKKGSWDQVERESHQKRVASKVCELLRTGEDILGDVVDSFETLKRFFCRIAGEPAT